jgi:hypothetical protein
MERKIHQGKTVHKNHPTKRIKKEEEGANATTGAIMEQSILAQLVVII